MKISSLLAALIVAFGLCVPSISMAETKKKAAEPAKKEEPKTDAKKDHYPLYGQLVSITDTLLTVKGGEGKPDRKFDITKETKITKDGKSATAKDAKDGQWVGGYVKKAEGKGNDSLVSLNLSAKQKEAKPEAVAPKKK